MFEFWSVGRSGISYLPTRRPTLRQFRAAIASCGYPRPFAHFTRTGEPGFPRIFIAGLQFMSGEMFRCQFSIRIYY